MSKRLKSMVLKTKHWGIGFDFEISSNVTIIDLMFMKRTLRISIRNKAQMLEQEKRAKAFQELRKLSEELGETY